MDHKFYQTDVSQIEVQVFSIFAVQNNKDTE